MKMKEEINDLYEEVREQREIIKILMKDNKKLKLKIERWLQCNSK